MKLGDLSGGAGKLHHSLKGLRHRWQQTQEVWQDKARKEFEDRYLRQLDPKTVQAIEAVNRLAQVLTKAYDECS